MEPTEEPAQPGPGTGSRAVRRAVRRVATDAPVDLSPVGRYVRETETPLDRVLAAAQEQETALLLDEADALVGRRTDVAEAHDRYADPDPAPPEDPPGQPSTSEP